MISIFRRPVVQSFFLVIAIVGALGIILLALKGYQESFLFLNQIRWSVGDLLMPHLTHLGDGVIATVIAGAFLWKKPPALILLILTMVLIGIIIPVFKLEFFTNWDRPLKVFTNPGDFYFIGTKELFRNSFPSGHSAAIAASISILILNLDQVSSWIWGVLIALFMLLIAYSRLYIGVHFLGDILAGTGIGILVAVLVNLGFQNSLSLWWESRGEKTKRIYLRSGLFLLLFFSIAGIWLVIDNYYS